jgi:hypothetical protein
MNWKYLSGYCIKGCLVCLFFELTFSGAGSVRGDTITVGDPKDPGALPVAIDQAHRQGASDITVSPGIYDLPSRNGDTIRLENWSDTTVHAGGVTLVFEDLAHRPLHLVRCQHVTWDGGTLRFAHPSFTQGRIKAIASDAQGNFCDWQIDAGYSTDVIPLKSTFDVVDAQTRLLKVGTGDWGPQSCEQVGSGLFRLRYRQPPLFAVNDWLVTRAAGGSTIAHMDGCSDCTLKNMTFENGGFATFFETGGAGGNHYLNCKIQLGPRPFGATEDELVSCGADGFHSTGTGTGPDIEDCVFTGIFLDDCIAIHGTFDRVTSASGATLVVTSRPENRPMTGEPLRISNTDGFFAQAMCTAVVELPDHSYQATLDQALNVPIDHSEDADSRKGTKANDPDHCGRGFKILRCRLGETRSRGILVKADDGVIDSCQIEGCAMSGVSLGPEFWWNEANYVWNVAVTNNVFLNCSKGRDQGSLWIHGDGAIGNRNITIANNQFETCYGPYLLKIEYTDGVQITGNTFNGSFQTDSHLPGNIVWINQSKNVKMLGNLVSNQGPFAGEMVALTPGTSASDVQNNDSTGISLSPATSGKP